jgi:tripartite-type tricarboxylate transporter receptor subunit TctC
MLALARILAAPIAALMACMPSAHAADRFPTKPMRFIVPAVAGASADIAARAIAEQLTKRWGEPVIVDNRPGAGTIVATQALASAAPDGNTFGWVIAAHAINPNLYAKLPYDTVHDFSGVTLIYQLRVVIVAPKTLPANNVGELLSLIRRQPDFLYTSSGVGTGPHLLGELFKQKYGVEMTHVGYKNVIMAHTDVIAGRLPLMFDTLPTALPYIEAGKLKAIAVISDKPLERYPQFPPLRRLLPADATTGWNGIVVPAHTPRAIVAQLNTDIVDAIRSPAVQARFAALTVETVTSTPERFDAFIREEIARWGDVVKRAGIILENQ